jgi:hypothetical protein
MILNADVADGVEVGFGVEDAAVLNDEVILPDWSLCKSRCGEEGKRSGCNGSRVAVQDEAGTGGREVLWLMRHGRTILSGKVLPF